MEIMILIIILINIQFWKKTNLSNKSSYQDVYQHQSIGEKEIRNQYQPLHGTNLSLSYTVFFLLSNIPKVSPFSFLIASNLERDTKCWFSRPHLHVINWVSYIELNVAEAWERKIDT